MRPDTPRPEDIEDSEDVHALMTNIRERHIKSLDCPDGETLWIFFEEDTYYEEYRLEINFHSGNLWLHHETDDGVETLWMNKRRY